MSVAALVTGRSDTPPLDLELVAGVDGLDRIVTDPAIQKTGLALAGFHEHLKPGRVLVFAESEIRYLEGLSSADRSAGLARALARDIPCIVVTDGLTGPPEVAIEAERARVPVLRTTLAAATAIVRLTNWLDDRLAERDLVHGVLLDVLGLGVLITGESGIGKSECALDLIVRGHRLVADDTVEVRRRADTVVIGTGPALTRFHMEIRGLGIINVRDLFGVAATRSAKRIELVVRLERWEPGQQYERLGLGAEHTPIVGHPVPLVRMPVAPGRNVAILVEVAARNQLLRARGRNAAQELAARLDRQLARARRTPEEGGGAA